MTAETRFIVINGLNDRDKEKSSSELVQILRNNKKVDKIWVENDNKNAMDLGSTVAIVLGTGGIIALAEGVKLWLSRWHNVSINIKNDKGQIIAENISRKDIEKIEKILDKL